MAYRYRWLKRIRDLFFPPKCSSCKKILDLSESESALCGDCLRLWKDETSERCGHCQRLVGNCECMTEQMKKAGCKSFCKAAYYRHGKGTPVPNRLIFRIKNNQSRKTSDFLAGEVWNSLCNTESELLHSDIPKIICYIPRRRASVLQYGTDQARELAISLSRISGFPVKYILTRNRKGDRQQKKLSPGERLKNAKEAFSKDDRVNLNGEAVFLVDDIVTTGASMAVCTKLLKKAGASVVVGVSAVSDDANKEPLCQNITAAGKGMY